MMNTAKTASAVLLEAEKRLRQLVGQAADGGEYDVAVRVATAARGLAALAAAINGVGPDTSDAGHHAATVPGGGSLADPANAGPVPRSGPAPASRSGRSPSEGTYPRFFRQGDCLVKVAWSKSERSEYQHKAERRVIDLLAAAIAKRGAHGRRFTSDEIFPLKDPETGEEVPTYQAYAVLAWFRQAGLVRSHGRKGYTAENPGKLSEAVAAAWETLREEPV